MPGQYEDDQLTQELQFLYEGDRLRGVAGLYYLDAHAAGKFDTVVGLLNLTIATSGFVDTTSYAAYADFSYDFTDKLSASLGGRYTNDDKEGGVYRQNFTGLYSPLFGNNAAIPGLVRSDYTNDRSFDQFTPRASVSYKFTDSLTTYASYAEGFKSGGFDMRGDVVLTPDTVNGYEPESVSSYEIGVKGFAVRRPLLVQPRRVLRGLHRPADHAPAADGHGLDRELRRQRRRLDHPGRGTRRRGAVHREVLADVRPGLDRRGVRQVRDVPGHHQPGAAAGHDHGAGGSFGHRGVPEHAGVERQPGAQLRPAAAGQRWGSLLLTASASYRDSYYMFEFPNPLIDQNDSYTLFDASVTWTAENEKLRFQLVGRNLTDEEYKIGGYYFPGATFGNIVNSFYGPPRTVSLSASYRFD